MTCLNHPMIIFYILYYGFWSLVFLGDKWTLLFRLFICPPLISTSFSYAMPHFLIFKNSRKGSNWLSSWRIRYHNKKSCLFLLGFLVKKTTHMVFFAPMFNLTKLPIWISRFGFNHFHWVFLVVFFNRFFYQVFLIECLW